MPVLNTDKLLKADIISLGKTIMTAEPKQLTFNYTSNPDEFLIIIKENNLPTFQRGDSLSIIFQLRSGERIKYKTSVSLSTYMQLNLAANNTNMKILEERRRFYKVNAVKSCSIISLIRYDELREYKNPISALILNLSLGGVFLTTQNAAFIPDDLLLLDFTSDTDDNNIEFPAELSVKVLRVQYSDGQISGYGCQFINLMRRDEEILGKFIYKKQLEEKISVKPES